MRGLSYRTPRDATKPAPGAPPLGYTEKTTREGGGDMKAETVVDPVALREEVKDKYREVACNPHGEYHFHTGRRAAARLGYDAAIVDPMPDAAIESFAGVANPFSFRRLQAGEH